MTFGWKLHAFSIATTSAIAYVLCAAFDALYPPYGLLAVFAPASPWPISGSAVGFVSGLILSTVGGFLLGAIYGRALQFWSRRTR